MNLLPPRVHFRIGLALVSLLLVCGWNKANAIPSQNFQINCNTTTGTTALNNGALAVPDPVNTSSSTYNEIAKLNGGGTGTVQGYNCSVAAEFDASKAGKAITLSQMAKVTIGSTSYYQVLLDVKGNTGSNGPTFNQLQVYASSIANFDAHSNASNFSQLLASGTLAYDLGNNTLQVTKLGPTSNKTQFALYIPESKFGTFASSPASTNVYVYLNATGMQNNKDLNIGVDPGQSTTPEAHTVWGGISIGLILGIGFVRRRLAKPAPAC